MEVILVARLINMFIYGYSRLEKQYAVLTWVKVQFCRPVSNKSRWRVFFICMIDVRKFPHNL